ncbi:MAG TPA: methyltransferase domain-containing protein [Polyangiales bacterium]|nr:methyltransferase domain-containing protein [Polyangiales bacterium]
MSEEPRARSGGRRRHTTRRLLRHPSRLAGKAEASAGSPKVEESTEVVPDASVEVPIESAALVRNHAGLDVDEDSKDTAEIEPSTAKLDRIEASAPQLDDAAMRAAAARADAETAAVIDELVSVMPPDGIEAEAKTKPKIRLSDAAARRLSPPPKAPEVLNEPAPAKPPSIPPLSGPLASLPTVGRTPLPPIPSGEGIVRNSQPRIVLEADPRVRRDSDMPTRPRIPLTQDMALAAGRITSQEVAPYRSSDEGPIRSRTAHLNPPPPVVVDDSAPSVIVARAHVISDAPPANDRPEGGGTRRSRRPRPESEEFETLDLDDEDTDEMSRLDIDLPVDAPEISVRVSRTPPPPPMQTATKRGGAITGQHASGPQASRAAPPPPPPTAPPRKSTTSTRKTSGRKRAWWEVLFSDDYIRTLPKVSQTATQKQVNFMEASLGIKRGDSVLDVGCGLGHHALEFARRGYLVVALDLALSMITRAAEDAQQRGLRINFLHKDIRDIGFEGTFDAVICVGTTFGFFDDEQNRSVLQRLAHALKPGGRLLLDVVNRDFVINSQPNLVWFEGDGCVVMEESDFNFYSSRLHVKRTMMREDGRQTDVDYNLRLYSVHELGQMLKQCGFVIREVSGQEATRGCFFGAQSSRIVLLAERKPFTRTQSGEEGAGTPPNANGLDH